MCNVFIPCLIAALSLGTVGCDKTADVPAAAPAAAPEPAAAPQANAVVDGYDGLRATLADDDLAKTKALATAYKAVVTAEAGGDAAMLKGLDAIAAAPEIEAARDGFGVLSEGYIKFLGTKPELKEGLAAFRCPMARGYKKWVQRDRKMMNPYMGKAMLECGGPTELTP